MTTTEPTPTSSRKRFPLRLAIGLFAAVLAFSGLAIVRAEAASGPKPTVTVLGADVAHLSWSVPSGVTGTIAGYRVKYSTSSSMSSAKYWPSTTSTEVTDKLFANVTGLTVAKTYYFQVAAFDALGAQLTDWSSSTSGKTAYSYGTPTGLVADNISGTSVELTWVNVSGAPGYSVKYVSSTGGTKLAWNQVENFTLSGLEKNTAYTISVAVQQPPTGTEGTSGYTPLVTMGAFSSSIKVTTSNYGMAAPNNLVVTNQKFDRVTVSWDAPDGMPADGYQYALQYSLKSDMSSALTANSPSPSYELTGLANNTNYYVRVMVVDAAKKQMSDRSAYQLAKTRIPTGIITGKVEGAPGKDVVAMAYSSAGELVKQVDVASNGSYSLSLRPETYKLRLSYLGTSGYTSLWANAGSDGMPDSTGATSVSIATGETKAAPTVELAKGATLEGSVKNQTGSLLNGVDVASLTAMTSAREIETVVDTPATSAGTFKLTGLSEGAHWVRFIKTGYANLSVWIKVENARVTQYRVSSWATAENLDEGDKLALTMTAA